MADTVQEHVDEILKEHRVVLFMNGTVETPADAESAMARDILSAIKVAFFPVDVSRQPVIAQEVSTRSGMPKMAQLFIDGGFIVDSFLMPDAVASEDFDKILDARNVSYDAEMMQTMRDMNQ
ncbi:monothiol glutaredoxin [Litoreibacter ponti]|uniref:Monothiol glutaredoxin n=1 Tax=Litoreibacter ponti TaxID=1510457 RepID=A0A2T6BJJ8_9RHOB|nr:glutaredoxin domain-containing protein [Litoreibacter ponti]PTX56212.1 monothiol glutaredoxin [Litoreibacter ponti]